LAKVKVAAEDHASLSAVLADCNMMVDRIPLVKDSMVCGGPCRQDGLALGERHVPADAGCRLRHIQFRWATWLLSDLTREEAARLAGPKASTCCGQRT